MCVEDDLITLNDDNRPGSVVCDWSCGPISPQDQSRSTAAREPATSDAVSQTSLGSERSARAPSSSASAPAVTQTVSQAVTQAVTHAVTQAVTQAVTEQAATQQQAITTHSSLLATSCSLSARRWPGGGALPSAGSDGTVSPAESVSVLPEESRSQLIHTGTESRGSRSRRGTASAAAAAQVGTTFQSVLVARGRV